MARKRTGTRLIDIVDTLPKTRDEARRLGYTGPKAAKRMRERDPEEAAIERRAASAMRGAQTRRENRPYSMGQRATRRAAIFIEPHLHELAKMMGNGNFTQGVRRALIEAEERRLEASRTAVAEYEVRTTAEELEALRDRIREIEERENSRPKKKVRSDEEE